MPSHFDVGAPTPPLFDPHRMDTCAAVAEGTGFFTVHPYDDYDTMAGQGTIGLELLEQVIDSISWQ